jgi:hypothetical protein
MLPGSRSAHKRRGTNSSHAPLAANIFSGRATSAAGTKTAVYVRPGGVVLSRLRGFERAKSRSRKALAVE